LLLLLVMLLDGALELHIVEVRLRELAVQPFCMVFLKFLLLHFQFDKASLEPAVLRRLGVILGFPVYASSFSKVVLCKGL
jgi:hypothetical protein